MFSLALAPGPEIPSEIVSASPVAQAFFCLTVLGLSVLLVRWVLAKFPESRLETPRWTGADVFLLGLSWLLLNLSSGFLVAAGKAQYLLGEDQSRVMFVLLVAASTLAVAALVILTVRRRYGQSLQALGLGTGTVARGLLQGGLVYLAFLPGVYSALVVWYLALTQLGIEPVPQPLVKEFYDSIQNREWALPIAIAASAIVAAPLFEELFFRGLLFRWLARYLPVSSSVLVSSFIFALAHNNVLAFGPVFALGVVLAVSFARTGNIWTSIGLHAAFNGGQFVIGLVWLKNE